MAVTINMLRCHRCGALVDVGDSDLPLTYVTRQETDSDLPTFLIIGEHREQSVLLHSCTMRS